MTLTPSLLCALLIAVPLAGMVLGAVPTLLSTRAPSAVRVRS